LLKRIPDLLMYLN